ncbi:MAG: hypothetical protein RLZZ28_2043 [Bacteroidota bacterium]|jgi:ABC-2 type transport system ATP-binding protein
MSIQVKELVKIYGEQKAVNHASFEVKKGEIVGFLGPNGAGKSTTMKILTGYLQADAGSALICGIDVADNPIAIKKKIGYLPEANPLYFDMYVREYLSFVAGVHAISEVKTAVEKSIGLTGLGLEAKKKISQLSKGYKQRVGLAAALIHDPEVLILDEPTSGLDPNQIVEIRNVIRQQGQNKTVLFSSHILQEVEAICDRVIIINNGRIVANDTLTALQKGKKDNTIVTVVFKESVNPAWLQKLSSVVGYSRSESGNLPEQQINWKLETTQPDTVKKELLNLAIENNLNIISLQTEQFSLEEVFKNLTVD